MSEIPQEERDMYYTLSVQCTNCGWAGKMNYPKGTTVQRAHKTCPQCDCNSLVKAVNVGRTIFPPGFGETSSAQTTQLPPTAHFYEDGRHLLRDSIGDNSAISPPNGEASN